MYKRRFLKSDIKIIKNQEITYKMGIYLKIFSKMLLLMYINFKSFMSADDTQWQWLQSNCRRMNFDRKENELDTRALSRYVFLWN